MTVIGVAGLPGSGKSALMDYFQNAGYSRYDDINRDWNENLRRAKTEAQTGKNLVISDTMFCKDEWRVRLESELGTVVQWVFFENNPWQCAKNCLYRFMYEKRHRPLQDEVNNILSLSPTYSPHGDVRPVVNAESKVRK